MQERGMRETTVVEGEHAVVQADGRPGVLSEPKVPCAGVSQREYCLVLIIPGNFLGFRLRSGFGGQLK
jgi:hypothetical protein